ncbi:MAG: Glycosyl transferase, group 1 domain protein [Candidatus Syntrophoarchaeum caldarius]|uniref:Glycosyl transferase, group 1 domain protein n=1 Tax=Candidatus Syntropharchaeum caldarium TaxID=1838285 RepID=A0A1F2P926_9EURY|nr:MAG: Glycosyl transferase, group 1 domain protein [Candidatus Syntrophoarchaeum caldarius]
MPSDIKILLKGAKSGTHSVYQELIDYPPENCTFLHSPTKKLSIDRLLGAGTYYCKLLNIGIASRNADLTHSHQQLILNRIPWVVDFEHAGAFVHFHHQSVRRCWNRRIIEKLLSSKNCKRILPWSFAAKKSLENVIDFSKLEDKTEVVYPAIHNETFKKSKNDKFKILFVGIRFIVKGGKEVLDTFKILDKKYDNLELILISDVPEYIKNQYKDYDNIKIIDSYISRYDLFKNYYPNADIFVFPTRIDTFGMVLLEAMNFELPIVSTNVFAIPEIIEDGKNGFLIPTKVSQYNKEFLILKNGVNDIRNILEKNSEEMVVQKLVEKISILIEDAKLRERMGKYGKKEIQEGKFSINNRNKKLRDIYEISKRR